MKKLLVTFAAMPFMAGIAVAGPPANTQVAPNATAVQLNDRQMDHITAGSFPAPSIAEAEILVRTIILTTPTSQLVRLPPLATYLSAGRLEEERHLLSGRGSILSDVRVMGGAAVY